MRTQNVRGVSREWVRNSGVDGRPSRATVRFSVVGAIRRRFACPAGHVFGTEKKSPQSSPRRTSCTFRLKRRRCAVSSARPTTVMLRGWGAGCEGRAGKGADNRERRPVKLGDLPRRWAAKCLSNRTSTTLPRMETTTPRFDELVLLCGRSRIHDPSASQSHRDHVWSYDTLSRTAPTMDACIAC